MPSSIGANRGNRSRRS